MEINKLGLHFFQFMGIGRPDLHLRFDELTTSKLGISSCNKRNGAVRHLYVSDLLMFAIGPDGCINGLLDLCILLFVDFDFLLDSESGSNTDDIPNRPDAKYRTASDTNNRGDGDNGT